MLASFPGHVVKFEKSGLVSTVCACAAPQVFLGILRCNITPSIIVLSFVTRIQLKVVSLSEESRNEAIRAGADGLSPCRYLERYC